MYEKGKNIKKPKYNDQSTQVGLENVFQDSIS